MKTEKLFAFGLIAYALTQRKPPRVVPPPRPSVPYQPNNAASYQAWLAWTQQVLRAAQSAYGSFEKAYQALWGPGGIFYKEPLPKYDAGSLFWQEATAGLAGVGRIYKTAPPGKNLCADGTYSDLSGRGVCSRHGGVFLKKAKSRAAADAARKQDFEEAKQRIENLNRGAARIERRHPNGFLSLRTMSQKDKEDWREHGHILAEIEQIKQRFQREFDREKKILRLKGQLQYLKSGGHRFLKMSKSEAEKHAEDLQRELNRLQSEV